MIEGYSDIIVVPKDHLELFCHYCGIFAAMNLWVDAAVGTALLLSGSPVKTEVNSSYFGTEYWHDDELKKRLSHTNKKLDRIKNVFKEKELYIHPIKLSAYK